MLFITIAVINKGQEILLDYGCEYWRALKQNCQNIEIPDAQVHLDNLSNKSSVSKKKLLQPIEAGVNLFRCLKSSEKYKKSSNQLLKRILALGHSDKQDLALEDRYVQVIKIDQSVEDIESNTVWRLYTSPDQKISEEVNLKLVDDNTFPFYERDCKQYYEEGVPQVSSAIHNVHVKTLEVNERSLQYGVEGPSVKRYKKVSKNVKQTEALDLLAGNSGKEIPQVLYNVGIEKFNVERRHYPNGGK